MSVNSDRLFSVGMKKNRLGTFKTEHQFPGWIDILIVTFAANFNYICQLVGAGRVWRHIKYRSLIKEKLDCHLVVN